MFKIKVFSRKSKVSIFSVLFVLFLCCFVPSRAKAMCYLDFKKSLQQATKTIKNETKNSVLITKTGSAMYIGDMHGDIDSARYNIELATAKLMFGEVDYVVFTGDYVDRGGCSLDVLYEIAEFKKNFPEKVILLRGNHETDVVNHKDGLAKEIYNCGINTEERTELIDLIYDFFGCLPLAAVIDSDGTKTLAVHGGIPKLDDNENLFTVLDSIPGERVKGVLNSKCREQEILMDILWSDPDTQGKGSLFHQNSARGAGKIFGYEALKAFCEKHGIAHVIRGHSHSMGGQVIFDGKLVTVMSRWKDPRSTNCVPGGYAITKGDELQVEPLKRLGGMLRRERPLSDERTNRFSFFRTEEDSEFSDRPSRAGDVLHILKGFRFFKYKARNQYAFIIVDIEEAKKILTEMKISPKDMAEVFKSNNKIDFSNNEDSIIKKIFQGIISYFKNSNSFPLLFNYICANGSLITEVKECPVNGCMLSPSRILRLVNNNSEEYACYNDYQSDINKEIRELQQTRRRICSFDGLKFGFEF